MKFNELSKTQQTTITAWINGETLQYTYCGEWYDIRTITELYAYVLRGEDYRIKPKEPVVSIYYSVVFTDGSNSCMKYSSISQIWKYLNDKFIHSIIMKTFHDGVFVKAEIIPKLELSLKGLV